MKERGGVEFPEMVDCIIDTNGKLLEEANGSTGSSRLGEPKLKEDRMTNLRD
jgi:hypothetical protein